MTYRSDHDAALARVAALEAENARLTAALRQRRGDSTPPAQRRPARHWLQALVLIPLVGGMAAAIVALTSGTYVKAETDRNSRRAEELHRCAVGLAARGHAQRSALTLDELARTTGCRPEIRDRLDRGLMPLQERRALERWSDTEDALANKVSALTTFYTNHRADDASGDPLWREYNDAFDNRQAAVSDWLAVR